MFLGSRVDDALSLYYRRILEHREWLELDQVKDAYRELWSAELEAQEQELGVDWQDIHQHAAFELGLQALELTFEQLVPKLGEPLAVQRRVEFALAPGLVEWTVVCYLDLETRGCGLTGEEIQRVVDYKVKTNPINQPKADRDSQASLYLAGRWLEGQAVFRIRRYSTVTYPGQGFTRRVLLFRAAFRPRHGLPSGTVLDLDLAAVHQPGFRPFLVRGEVSAYWTVYDGVYEPVEVADCYLRRIRFGSGKALGTTRMYAGNLALFFEFCVASGRSLRRAALEFDRFAHYLAVTPTERRGRGQGQLRSPERVNHILGSVRELYREAVARGQLDGDVLRAQFSVERGFRLRVGVVEGQQMTLHERPRHRLREAKRGRPPTVSFEQFAALMGACRTWRDRSILALLGRAGLRCGEAVTLRMSDVHLAESSLEVGCSEPGPHLHVRAREDLDGGATKSRDPRIVPADDLVVFCLDQYLLERACVPEAAGCDRLLVNLASAYRGDGMTPDRLGALLDSLSRRAGLEQRVTPHRLRHRFASELEAAGAGLVLIQQLLGHRRIASSQVYVEPGAAALRAAVERASGRTRMIADAVLEEKASGGAG